jgi:hypothetical protein
VPRCCPSCCSRTRPSTSTKPLWSPPPRKALVGDSRARSSARKDDRRQAHFARFLSSAAVIRDKWSSIQGTLLGKMRSRRVGWPPGERTTGAADLVMTPLVHLGPVSGDRAAHSTRRWDPMRNQPDLGWVPAHGRVARSATPPTHRGAGLGAAHDGVDRATTRTGPPAQNHQG